MGNFITNHQKNQYGELGPQLFIDYQLAGVPEPLSNSLDIFEMPVDTALSYPNSYPVYGNN
jgi:hypothetical protein